MRRIHPFVVGHVVTALVAGAITGATLDAEAAVLGGAVLAAGASISSVVCWWKPGFEAAAWLLVPVAILANPLMLVALGDMMFIDFGCLMGSKKGWDCLGFAIAVVVAGVCLVPPFGGWLWRAWRRRRPEPA
jgi:hypothetical protein